MSTKFKIILPVLLILVVVISLISMIDSSPQSSSPLLTPTTSVLKRSFPIEVRTIGELEAEKSISIASSIRSDQPKVIDLISDGTSVAKGDLLVKIDATPFETKIEELQASERELEGKILTLEQAWKREIEQAEHELKVVNLEMETCELELKKIIHGDGPLEEARLKGAMQKAKVRYDELNSYSEDLLALESQGFLNAAEVRQSQKKLQEEKENYENAKMQYESFMQHVHPMQIKKAEMALKRLMSKQEESVRTGKFNVEKARLALVQAQQQFREIKRLIKESQYELTLTEIRAPTPGMVVLREEYRSNQRRKPRVGDTLVRNQPILDLPDLSSMMVKAKVREIDLYKIALTKPVTVEIDAFPNKSFQGKISFIGILALADVLRVGDEKHFEVKVAIADTDPCLRPGMTARITIHADQLQQVLSVPIHSVFEYDRKHYCYLCKKEKFIKVPVEIGMNNEEWIHIVSGLNEFDQVSLALPPEECILDQCLPLNLEKKSKEEPAKIAFTSSTDTGDTLPQPGLYLIKNSEPHYSQILTKINIENTYTKPGLHLIK